MHLKVGQDGKAVLPNTMDVLTCMDGKVLCQQTHIQQPRVHCDSGRGEFSRQEDTAAFLAGKGFTTLALAFFGLPGLPR